MDNFTYHYKTTNNQLTLINDAVNSSNQIVDYLTDIKDQSNLLGIPYDLANPDSHNYVYDKIGQLIQDKTEGLSIKWRVDGKVKKILKNPLNTRVSTIIKFDYDGLGNRIAKKITYLQSPDQTATYYVRDAQGNTLAVYKATTAKTGTLTGQVKLTELNLYGSSRLGLEQKDLVIYDTNQTDPNPTYNPLERITGDKRYELTNHLGNVLSVVSDKKIPTFVSSSLSYFNADIKSYNDYYPFGMLVPQRNYQSPEYRYGFQGQEKDDEIKGNGNSINYKYRMHDPRVGRFFAIDPLTAKYPHYSPYSFSGNKVIHRVELEGLEDAKFNMQIDWNTALKMAGEDATTEQVVEKYNQIHYAGTNQIKTELFKSQFSHYLPKKFIDKYSSYDGGTLNITEQEALDVNPYSVAIYQGKNSKKYQEEKDNFLNELNSLKAGESKKVKLSVSGKAGTQGSLGQFTINFEGILTRGDDKEWSFEGTMQFYDKWDFDKKKEGGRTSGSETATQIGRLFLPGKGFDIYSPKIKVKQTSKDQKVDWWKDKEIKEVKSNAAELVPYFDEEKGG